MQEPDFLAKCLAPDQAAAAVQALRARGPVVLTNGVFDVLHRGHVTYLAQARTLGASLVVALNTRSRELRHRCDDVQISITVDVDDCSVCYGVLRIKRQLDRLPRAIKSVVQNAQMVCFVLRCVRHKQIDISIVIEICECQHCGVFRQGLTE